MKLLKTITHPDFPTPWVEIVTREAARIILVDINGMMPFIYSSEGDVYKIPGWGIDEWETLEDAAIREAREETGCEVNILWEVWKVIDRRPAYVYKKWLNLTQTSYCFYWEITSIWDIQFTESEKARWFELVWLRKEEVLEKIKSCRPKKEREKISLERDRYIFEEYLKV
jgi:8-oxo-dGTP diphosphatase